MTARTSTSSFGVSRRHNHDSSAFYARFTPPELTTDTTVDPDKAIDRLFLGDSRDMAAIAEKSVALVVTSPPYFAGKEYEQDIDGGRVPGSYGDYLQMLEEVFAECVRTLEPGGRMAVNVANLGRRPYRSLSADVIDIVQRLGLLLRGEVIWVKAKGAAGSTAWGSFQRPANPVLRDLTERIVIASKGRFDRALNARAREEHGLPHVPTISRDEFMEATTDVWEMAPESATKVGHPAPFPVELPQRLILLYTYRDDLVLDPFIGSGTTAVAAVRNGRHFAGYDLDESYLEIARRRIEAELASLRSRPAPTEEAGDGDESLRQAVRNGTAARELARRLLEESGFVDIEVTPRLAVDVSFRAGDGNGRQWLFEVAGGFTSSRPGLARSEILWRTIGKAAVLHHAHPDTPLVLLASSLPPEGSPAWEALRQVSGPGKPVVEVICLADPGAKERLHRHLAG
jgi:DNA modification methylase